MGSSDEREREREERTRSLFAENELCWEELFSP
jgi:hypothetical protein